MSSMLNSCATTVCSPNTHYKTISMEMGSPHPYSEVAFVKGSRHCSDWGPPTPHPYLKITSTDVYDRIIK